MKRLLALCISLQIAFVLLYITGILPELNAYAGAIVCLIIGFASMVLSLYSAGKKFSLGVSFLAFIFSLFIICFTIFIYFLPEAGMPPVIPLFD
ncbi:MULTISPECIES: hypothetical protein [Bacillaceae]|uniref:Uncharacterized protein n=1 Tax=Peribacillus simplex TaxID=1478 RepID=A0A109MX41_9BACI|nr:MULTISPECIES: hypothetical protein [Bacillaceae]KWW17529.1 hypothetical protein AS888_21125 [Peribacillus simplex]PJN87655.1 hypothetical protein CVN76_24735 [Bacillus sp. mrc49]